MAVNKLYPTSDLATRDFFRTVANDDQYLKDSPAHRRQLLAILLEALNYVQLPNGAFVSRDANIAIPFGSSDYSEYEDEWEADTEAAYAAIDLEDTTEASASSEASDTEVREAVLSEDVR
jgi:hypothetical protein